MTTIHQAPFKRLHKVSSYKYSAMITEENIKLPSSEVAISRNELNDLFIQMENAFYYHYREMNQLKPLLSNARDLFNKFESDPHIKLKENSSISKFSRIAESRKSKLADLDFKLSDDPENKDNSRQLILLLLNRFWERYNRLLAECNENSKVVSKNPDLARSK